MTTHDCISLALFIAWCAVAFCEGALFGLWLADWHYGKANDKRKDATETPNEDAKEDK